jgi:hypothetical protein
MYNGDGDCLGTDGASSTADDGIAVSIEFGVIAPGAAVTKDFILILSDDVAAVEAAPPPPPAPITTTTTTTTPITTITTTTATTPLRPIEFRCLGHVLVVNKDDCSRHATLLDNMLEAYFQTDGGIFHNCDVTTTQTPATTPATTPAPITTRFEPCMKADIVLVNDVSGSTSKCDQEGLRAFSTELVQLFDELGAVKEDGVRFASM